MPRDCLTEERAVVLVERVEIYHLAVEPLLVEVEHVGDTTAHAGGDVASGAAEDDDAPPRHVLAGMVTDALDDRDRTGVADAEPLPHDAAHEHLAAGGAVEDDVARDDVVLRTERRVGVGGYADPPAGHPFPDVVVGVSDEPHRDAARNERAE